MKHKHTSLSLGSMTDIAFLLLLFFMVLSIQAFQMPADIQLPQEQATIASEEPAVFRIFVTQDGVWLDEMGNKLDIEQLQLQSDTAICVSADAQARIEQVYPMIQLLGEQGISNVSFAVESPAP